ncbi:glycogen debranching protein GlgX [Kineosporia sp. NBRC 101731]|uniref:glycogen debranching protein GlgX n=1 Tax=Kineosporia sp. NBRC 101731 TaxID=3032199 RepID=UPI002555CAC6|nr:glycogen debranching protein GlgX [Kineosporia sp. NBRC 101731]
MARSLPYPLGVHPRDQGVDVAVMAAHADRVQLCLLDPDPADAGRWSERRIDLPNLTYGIWHGFVPDVQPGQRYGLRVHGPWDPRGGHRHNPAKLLLDPYARAVVPPEHGLRPELFGHPVDAELKGNPRAIDHRDSMPYAAHGVVLPASPPGPSTKPHTPWARTVIYETHVRGLTKNLPGVPEGLRGTYAGLAHPATIEYLTGLGVTALELLPVHVSQSEGHLEARGLTNYWGYNTLGFFAPNPAYAAADDPVAVVTEFRQMVQTLHEAGLEVLLDVVYNHTCEAGVVGPTLSFRGLDAATYYRLDGDGRDIDFTGCGNSLDSTQARVVQLVLDSLRYWVQEMDIDGFRFDLAPTLARGRNEYHADHPMLVAMRVDPVLAGAKLIAEPWDLGPDGWRTGQFPPPFAEWNDRYRDDVRDFWLTSGARVANGETSGGLRDLGTRIAGSADTFDASRGPGASVNFISAHDGFTLADLTAYNVKHNQDNGEDNRDGTDNNHSWNHGVEGPTDDLAVLTARRRNIRNMLATLLFSAGVPMLVAGDEFGRSQNGNNNPYSQDSPVSWLDWDLEPWQDDLLATTRHLVSLRQRFGAVHPSRFFTGEPGPSGLRDVAWFAEDGTEMTMAHWGDAQRRMLQVLFAEPSTSVGTGGSTGSLLLVIAGAALPPTVILPDVSPLSSYELLWDSAEPRPPAPGSTTLLPPATEIEPSPDSVRLYVAR